MNYDNLWNDGLNGQKIYITFFDYCQKNLMLIIFAQSLKLIEWVIENEMFSISL